MGILLPFILPAVLFLLLEWLWCRPQPWWPQPVDALPEYAGPPPSALDLDPFALPFVRHRLAALAAELEWLEHGPPVFAKAFRTRVAQLAYDALLVDASRLAAVTTIEMEFCASVTPLKEELEL